MRINNNMAGQAFAFKSRRKKMNSNNSKRSVVKPPEYLPISPFSQDRNSNDTSTSQNIYNSEKLERIASALAKQGYL